jgi:hypothetical protein
LKAILKSDLSSEDVKKLLTFALQCRADTFTTVSPNENPLQEVFKSYYIGTKKSEAPAQPEEARRFEKLHFWRFVPASLEAIVQSSPQWLSQPAVRWGFYRYGEGTQLFLVVCGKAAYFIDLAVQQWEALFRLGFRFRFQDFWRQEFDESELPENKFGKELAGAAERKQQEERKKQEREVANQRWREKLERATDEERRQLLEQERQIEEAAARVAQSIEFYIDGRRIGGPPTEIEKSCQALISRVFHHHFKEGLTEFEFENKELYVTAREMKIKPTDLEGTISFLLRPGSLPEDIKVTAPKGTEWIIARSGQSYGFLLNRIGRVVSQQPPIPQGYWRPTPGAEINEYILSWWSAAHDDLLKQDIALDGWRWYPSVAAIENLTPKKALLQWQREDPKCLPRHSSEVLVEFARARAASQGYTRDIQWSADARDCAVCGEKFLPKHHWQLLQGAKHVIGAVCQSCVHLALKSGSIRASREEVLVYLKELTTALGRVPHQGFGDYNDLPILDETNVVQVMRTLRQKPSEMLVKGLFGSWLAALVEAGVLEGGVRRTFFGTQCLAKDGHVCLSMAEKTIDDLLTEMGIAHDKEVPYPEGGYRCDFVSQGVFIEYFGLAGDADYDEKTQAKQKLCKRLGLKLIAIYPEDLSSGSNLKKKLESIKASSQPDH